MGEWLSKMLRSLNNLDVCLLSIDWCSWVFHVFTDGCLIIELAASVSASQGARHVGERAPGAEGPCQQPLRREQVWVWTNCSRHSTGTKNGWSIFRPMQFQPIFLNFDLTKFWLVAPNSSESLQKLLMNKQVQLLFTNDEKVKIGTKYQSWDRNYRIWFFLNVWKCHPEFII